MTNNSSNNDLKLMTSNKMCFISAQWLYIEVGQMAAVESDEVSDSFSCFPHHFT